MEEVPITTEKRTLGKLVRSVAQSVGAKIREDFACVSNIALQQQFDTIEDRQRVSTVLWTPCSQQ
jgi:hypothetical protein